jgi:hypothetical protein
MDVACPAPLRVGAARGRNVVGRPTGKRLIDACLFGKGGTIGDERELPVRNPETGDAEMCEPEADRRETALPGGAPLAGGDFIEASGAVSTVIG